jgi:hypothetical protein
LKRDLIEALQVTDAQDNEHQGHGPQLRHRTGRAPGHPHRRVGPAFPGAPRALVTAVQEMGTLVDKPTTAIDTVLALVRRLAIERGCYPG